MEHPRFVIDFFLPAETFRRTGPLTITVLVNGELLGKAHFDQPGPSHYEQEVSSGLLRFGAVNLVSLEPDKVYKAAADGAILGFPLSRVGFVE